jgi:uncharacterized membrane protein YesL
VDNPLSVLGQTARSIWEDMFTLVLATGVWTAIGLLPALVLLGVGGPILAVIGLFITLPPATAGLFYVTNRIAHGFVGKMSHVLEGMRRYARQAWLLALINGFVVAVAVANFQFYGTLDAPWVIAVRSIWVALLLIWGSSQMYVFPMLLEQEAPRVRTALRNSLFLAFGSPALSITIALIIGFIGFILLLFFDRVLNLLPIVLLLPVLLALLTNIAVVRRLRVIRGTSDDSDG